MIQNVNLQGFERDKINHKIIIKNTQHENRK